MFIFSKICISLSGRGGGELQVMKLTKAPLLLFMYLIFTKRLWVFTHFSQVFRVCTGHILEINPAPNYFPLSCVLTVPDLYSNKCSILNWLELRQPPKRTPGNLVSIRRSFFSLQFSSSLRLVFFLWRGEIICVRSHVKKTFIVYL